jgi:hypothetical protein
MDTCPICQFTFARTTFEFGTNCSAAYSKVMPNSSAHACKVIWTPLDVSVKFIRIDRLKIPNQRLVFIPIPLNGF